ncbi:ATP-dependent RNA helicase DHX36 [Turdus rufiventris]|nr:ATP-dependent RNA helicase DHX36 [Turdus rufiventris]
MSYEQRRGWGRGRGRGGDGGSASAASSSAGGPGGRGRHPGHLKGREIGLWYARKQGQKNRDADRQQRAVVRMDERREEQIVQLLNSVQSKNDKEQEAMSWWSGDEESSAPEQPPKVKPDAEKPPVRQRPAWEKTSLDLDVEYLCEKTEQDADLDEQLKEDLMKKRSDPRYIEMQRFREKLPSYGMREVAERVAAERAEACGNGRSTGYQIRLQRHLSSISHVVLDEIHERNLQSDVLMSIIKDLLNVRLDLKVILMSATLNAEKFSEYFDHCPMIHIPGFTFPVVEYLLEDVIEKLRYTPEKMDRRVHWRKGFMQGHVSRPDKEEKEEIYREQWPAYLRQLQGRYSASTIDALEMMDDDKVDLDLVAALIRHIVLEEEDGAILVFLPGWDNISTLHEILMSQVMFKSDRFIIIPLHSLMPTVNQTQVFKKTPPGVRKIVIATNIAETSITIDDVVFVIDGGKIKETHFDTQNNISTMAAEWVSKANAKQRKGRAGRVQPGHCYHLYNGLRASLLDDYQLPEILRTPLEELCLQIKILRLGGIAHFLSKLMDPPSRDAVTLAINHLMELNALDRQEELTPLGVHLARLPVEPHIGKMILFGALFCCLDPVLTIAASLSFKDPFVIPLGWEEARSCGFRNEKDYCWEYFLSSNTLQMLHNMKGQFAEHLLAAGFVNSRNPKDPKSNTNSGNEKLLKAVICAGLYPKVAKIRPSFSKKRKMVKVCTKTDGSVNIHPKSVNVEETEFHYNWLVYHLKMRTSSIYLYDCTEVSPYCLLFFGGDISIQKDKDQDTIAVDEWIVFQSPEKIANLVKKLRQELDDLLQEKIENPHPVDWAAVRSRDTAVLTAIIDLITTQENEAVRNFAPRFQGERYS